MKNKFIESFGWLGVVCILGAYFLLVNGNLNSNNAIYLGLNLFGSVAILIDAWKDKNFQPVLLNIVWAAIAIAGLINVI